MKQIIDQFEILRKIGDKNDTSQRKLAKELGFSLGKLNYCLKELRNKGLIKLKNFNNQRNKISYLQYILTPKGISERTRLTISFMKRKIIEYEELQKELRLSRKLLNK